MSGSPVGHLSPTAHRQPPVTANGVFRQNSFVAASGRGVKVDVGFQKLRRRIYQKMRGQTASASRHTGLPQIEDASRVTFQTDGSPVGRGLRPQASSSGLPRQKLASTGEFPASKLRRSLVRSGERPLVARRDVIPRASLTNFRNVQNVRDFSGKLTVNFDLNFIGFSP